MTLKQDATGPKTGPGDLARAETVFADALEAFEITIDALRDAVGDLKARRRGSAEPEVLRDLKSMNAAFLFAMQMKEKARDAATRDQGGTGPGALDLERAREEIGLRLACLRSATQGGEVP